ncbi:MAG: hypothetical protein OXC62_02560 [Aestuariivita sp.]|nr:hypothetical protein [Aestuariivita sp.]
MTDEVPDGFYGYFEAVRKEVRRNEATPARETGVVGVFGAK